MTDGQSLNKGTKNICIPAKGKIETNLLKVNKMGIVERKEREREARRTQILDAAFRVFQHQGIGQASMDEIAKEAELAKGTIYLYYENKDELLIGLVIKGFEVLFELMAEETDKKERGIEKVIAIGEAYRRFATEHRFIFTLMHLNETPAKTNISPELVDELSMLSERVWKYFHQMTEKAKAEGDIKPEVNGFTLVLTLWLSGTGVLRMLNKCTYNSENHVFATRKNGVHLEHLNWQYVYNTTMRMLMENAVTDQGRAYLEPLQWLSLEAMGFQEHGVELERVFTLDGSAEEQIITTTA